MSEMTFTASMQKAVAFVLDHLVRPVPTSCWEQPRWSGFTWFTKIGASEIRELTERQPFQKPGDVYVQRDIEFFLGRDKVVVITMQGLRVHSSTSWTVQHVSYRLDWKTGRDQNEWVNRQLMAASYSGISPLVAPEG